MDEFRLPSPTATGPSSLRAWKEAGVRPVSAFRPKSAFLTWVAEDLLAALDGIEPGIQRAYFTPSKPGDALNEASALPDMNWACDILSRVDFGKPFWQDITPAAGKQFECAFDHIGNRKTTGWNGVHESISDSGTEPFPDFLSTGDLCSCCIHRTQAGQAPCPRSSCQPASDSP